jgi:hypothetical protein
MIHLTVTIPDKYAPYSMHISLPYDYLMPSPSPQVSYRGRGLTSEDIQGIASFFENVSELDLSENKMDVLPRGVPADVEALNLSKNRFKNLVGFDQLRGLCMLRLYRNQLER